MSIRRLKTLIAVADKGTFIGAADFVHISQAAVSQQMKSLEAELRVSLFNRNTRPPELSPTGLALVAKARQIISIYDNGLQSILNENELLGELVLGALPTTMNGLIPLVINELKLAYPKLHVRITPGLSGELMPKVDRGHLDVCILSEPPYLFDHLNWIAFAEEPLILLASEQAQGDDPAELLVNYPYIRFNRQAWVGRLIDQWLEDRRLKITESMELDSLESISSMVYYNHGVSIVPKRCVSSPVPLPLKRISLGRTARPRLLGILSRRDTAKARLIKVLLTELIKVVEKAGEVKVIK